MIILTEKLSNFVPLLELKRLELVNMSRENRYGNRATKIKYKNINVDSLLGGRTNHLDLTLQVADYKVVIRYDYFRVMIARAFRNLNYVRKAEGNKLSEKYKSLSMSQRRNAIASSVVYGLDNCDVRVKCECADFQYRFAYKATKYDYNLGFKETRPALHTNPNDKGSTCKHLVGALTAPSKYQKFVVRDVLKLIEIDPTLLDI